MSKFVFELSKKTVDRYVAAFQTTFHRLSYETFAVELISGYRKLAQLVMDTEEAAVERVFELVINDFQFDRELKVFPQSN